MNKSPLIKHLAEHGITATVTPVELSAQERQDHGDGGQPFTIAFRSRSLAMDLPGHAPSTVIDPDKSVARALAEIYVWIATGNYEQWCEMCEIDPSAASSKDRAETVEHNSSNWIAFVKDAVADDHTFHGIAMQAVFADFI